MCAARRKSNEAALGTVTIEKLTVIRKEYLQWKAKTYQDNLHTNRV